MNRLAMDGVSGDLATSRGSRGVLLGLSLFGLGLLGCGTQAEVTGECGSLFAGDVRGITWWEEDGVEGEALEVVLDAFGDCVGSRAEFTSEASREVALGVPEHFVNQFVGRQFTEIGGNTEAPEMLEATRVALEEHWSPPFFPPDVLQVLGGSDIDRFGGQSDGGLLALHREDGSGAGEHVLDGRVLAAVSLHGEQLASPIGIHRLNTLYVNERALARVGLAAEFERLVGTREFLDLLESYAVQVGAGQKPLALIKEGWAVSQLVFENIMPGLLGADAHSRFWEPRQHGVGELDQTALSETLEQASRVQGLVRLVDGIDDALQRFCSDEVAFIAMGDWRPDPCRLEAEPPLTHLQAFPGTEEIYVYSVDAFAIPKYNTSPDAARSFLRVISVPSIQEEYQVHKGGRAAVSGFPEGVRVIKGLTAAIPARAFWPLEEKVYEFIAGAAASRNGSGASLAGDPGEVLDVFATEYCHLLGACLPQPGPAE